MTLLEDFVAGKYRDQPEPICEDLRALANDPLMSEAERDARAVEVLGGWPLKDQRAAERLRPSTNGHGPHDEDDADPANWEPVDLGPAWRGEKTWPEAVVFERDDGVALILPGINYNHGDSGDGKSLLAAIVVLTELRAGWPAVWVTYEDANEELIVGRLRQLGATWDEVSRLHFFAATDALTSGVEQLAALAGSSSARLLVLDSIGEAMAVGGIDEDRDKDVGPWLRQTLRRIHEACPAVAIWPIDHATKAKDNPLFPSGSKRKRAAVTGRAYLLNVRAPFGIGAVGYVQLVVAKDRGGRFKRGEIAAEIMLDATATPYQWAVTAPRDGDSYTPKLRRRTAVDRVLEVLGESAVAMTAEDVARIANGSDRTQPGEGRLAVKTVQNALGTLADDPQVRKFAGEKADGRFPPAVWQLTRPEEDGDEQR